MSKEVFVELYIGVPLVNMLPQPLTSSSFATDFHDDPNPYAEVHQCCVGLQQISITNKDNYENLLV